MLLLSAVAKADEVKQMFDENSTIQDILATPEFSGYAEKILPWDNLERNNPNIKIKHIGQILPWLSELRTDDILNGLNYLRSHQTFYNIYPYDDIRQKHTGLFFFKGRTNAPFTLICPGGGFVYVGSLHSGFPIALDLSEKGYNAFVLKYRSGSVNMAMADLVQALTYIFAHAQEFEVATDNYAVWGDSAGARMAAYLATYGTEAFGGTVLPKPAMAVVNYTGHSDYTPHTSPIFMAVGEYDGIANPDGMKKQAERLNKMGVETEFHLYPDLGHGFGLGTGTSADGWTNKAVRFWEKFNKSHHK